MSSHIALPEGRPSVTAVLPAEGFTEADIPLSEAADFDSPVGRGVRGTIEGRQLAGGNTRYLG